MSLKWNCVAFFLTGHPRVRSMNKSDLRQLHGMAQIRSLNVMWPSGKKDQTDKVFGNSCNTVIYHSMGWVLCNWAFSTLPLTFTTRKKSQIIYRWCSLLCSSFRTFHERWAEKMKKQNGCWFCPKTTQWDALQMITIRKSNALQMRRSIPSATGLRRSLHVFTEQFHLLLPSENCMQIVCMLVHYISMHIHTYIQFIWQFVALKGKMHMSVGRIFSFLLNYCTFSLSTCHLSSYIARRVWWQFYCAKIMRKIEWVSEELCSSHWVVISHWVVNDCISHRPIRASERAIASRPSLCVFVPSFLIPFSSLLPSSLQLVCLHVSLCVRLANAVVGPFLCRNEAMRSARVLCMRAKLFVRVHSLCFPSCFPSPLLCFTSFIVCRLLCLAIYRLY